MKGWLGLPKSSFGRLQGVRHDGPASKAYRPHRSTIARARRVVDYRLPIPSGAGAIRSAWTHERSGRISPEDFPQFHRVFILPKSSFGMSCMRVIDWPLLVHRSQTFYKITPPKRRFGEAEQTFQTAFSKHLSTFCSPNPVLKPLKSASKMRSEMFVRPSQIFVW
jgi:hypothetical protein